MKVKATDKESRRYWDFLKRNAKIVAKWPEWKRRPLPGTLKEPPGRK